MSGFLLQNRRKLMIPVKNLLLKQLIWSKGLTQKDIAYRIGMHEPELSNIVNGYSRPSKQEAQDISAILGEPIESLFPESVKDD